MDTVTATQTFFNILNLIMLVPIAMTIYLTIEVYQNMVKDS